MGQPTPKIERLQRDRWDRFFVQQLVARRFRRDYRADFLRLRQVRDCVVTHVRRAGVNTLMQETLAQTTGALMGVYETEDGRQAIANLDLEIILANGAFGPCSGIMQDPASLHGVIYAMATYLEDVRHVLRTYNYCDYFKLIDMITICSCEATYELYLQATAEDIPIYAVNKSQDVTAEANLFFTRDDPKDLDLAVALLGSNYELMFSAPNITIFDGRHNRVVINDQPDQNSLFLKVKLDQAPHNIDYAIRAFRTCLLDALVERHGMVANIHRFEEFFDSSFVQDAASTNFLIKKWNEVQGSLIGLWCWDLVESQGKTPTEAMEYLDHTQAVILAATGDSEVDMQTNKKKAIEKHYLAIGNLIRAKDKDDQLSHFVTGDSEIHLGQKNP